MKKTKKGILTDEHRRLVEENLRLVGFMIHRVGLDGFDSYEDAYQTGVVALMEAAVNYDPRKSTFATYAINCIRNALISVRRVATRRRRRVCIVSLETPVCVTNGETIPLMDMLTADIPAIDKAITDREIAHKALELLREMPDDNVMQMMRMAVFAEKRQSDIADLLGYSQSYVSRAIRQARKSLREQMEEAGYDPRPSA